MRNAQIRRTLLCYLLSKRCSRNSFGAFWEIVLNYVGLDYLADYSEFIANQTTNGWQDNLVESLWVRSLPLGRYNSRSLLRRFIPLNY